MMRLHPSILPAKQRALLRRLGPLLTREGFYLGGGTALALLLGHRRSVDLDWFRPSLLDDPQSWTTRLRDQGFSPISMKVARGTVNTVINRVNVSLFEYQYRLLKVPVYCNACRSSLASLDDLACMKLSAVAQRGAKKDFVDVYALLLKHASLESMLNSYAKKFDRLDVSSVILGLTYFEDAERDRMPRTLWDFTWRDVKDKIRTAVRELRC